MVRSQDCNLRVTAVLPLTLKVDLESRAQSDLEGKMRIWYVVGTVEYWLEPEYSKSKKGQVRILGARLYNPAGQFKGYWRYPDWPLTVKRDVRKDVLAHIKHNEQAEKYQLQAVKMLKRRKIDTE